MVELTKHTIGAGATALAALALAGTASAAAPVSGSISGPVTSVKGSTFTMTTPLSPTGKATVSVGKSTTIVTQETLTRSALKEGVCAMATGQKNSNGVVAAQRISISAPVKGTCTVSFGGRRPGGTGAPPGGAGGGFGNFANLGFAFGTISAAKGDTLTVKGKNGTKAVTTTVTVSAKTQISKTARVGLSAITVKSCVFVRGTSTDKGVTVKAQNIDLSTPTSTGCRFGFRGR